MAGIQIDESFLQSLAESASDSAKKIAVAELENIRVARELEVAAEKQQQVYQKQEETTKKIVEAETVKTQETRKRRFREAANTFSNSQYSPSMPFSGALGVAGNTALRLGGNVFSIMFPNLARVVSSIYSAAEQSFKEYKDQEKKTAVIDYRLTNIEAKIGKLESIDRRLELISDLLQAGNLKGASTGSDFLENLLGALGIKGGFDALKKLTGRKLPSGKTAKAGDAIKSSGAPIENVPKKALSFTEKTGKAISGATKLGSKIATPLALGYESYLGFDKWMKADEALKKGEISQEEAEKEKTQAVTGTAGGVGGMFAGGVAGAGLGAAIGALGGPAAPVTVPLGALVGGIGGAIIGSESGREVGEDIGAGAKWLYDWWNKKEKEEQQKNATPVTPSNPMIQKQSFNDSNENMLYQSLSYEARNVLFNAKDFFIVTKTSSGLNFSGAQPKQASPKGQPSLVKASFGTESENTPSQNISDLLAKNVEDSANEATPSFSSLATGGGGTGGFSAPGGIGGLGYGGAEPSDLGTVKTKSGKTAKVAKEFVSAFQGFVNDLEATGYQIRSIGGYDRRPNVNNPSVMSYHASGAAIDINPDTNPNGSRKTDMPPNIREIAAKWGLGWGGDFKTTPDPMHFSAAKSEYGAADISRLGAATPFSNRPMMPEAQMQMYEKGIGKALEEQALKNETKQRTSGISSVLNNQQNIYTDTTSQSNKSSTTEDYTPPQKHIYEKFIGEEGWV